MKPRHVFPFFIVASVFLFTACFSTDVSNSEDVNQDKIYQKYFVACNASGTVETDVIFRFSSRKGNTLELTSPSTVLVNGKKLEGEKLLLRGYVYRKVIPIDKNGTYNFLYTDTDMKTYKNSIEIEPVAFNNASKIIKYASKTKIPIEPTVVKNNESVQLIITVNDTTKISLTSDSRKLKYFKLTPEDFTGIAPGKGEMKLVRTVKGKINETTSCGGKIDGNYTSEIIPIEIVE